MWVLKKRTTVLEELLLLLGLENGCEDCALWRRRRQGGRGADGGGSGAAVAGRSGGRGGREGGVAEVVEVVLVVFAAEELGEVGVVVGLEKLLQLVVVGLLSVTRVGGGGEDEGLQGESGRGDCHPGWWSGSLRRRGIRRNISDAGEPCPGRRERRLFWTRVRGEELIGLKVDGVHRRSAQGEEEDVGAELYRLSFPKATTT